MLNSIKATIKAIRDFSIRVDWVLQKGPPTKTRKGRVAIILFFFFYWWIGVVLIPLLLLRKGFELEYTSSLDLVIIVITLSILVWPLLFQWAIKPPQKYIRYFTWFYILLYTAILLIMVLSVTYDYLPTLFTGVISGFTVYILIRAREAKERRKARRQLSELYHRLLFKEEANTD